ncbi:HNH endonuclease [Arthrobacter zhangbolii]|uniref:HNH endonuclease n=1 Tax=Arthrobacter zhangbolii TaxID=2886936 RepID=A0A9X1S7Q3_9MICC|nr:HNH endonuclease signature motif containing protein [Arthrobacter zhangbolii]MCC3271735.1 HNH endonuclease [Arthrobacter zhangbolii]UON93438.1 HNH endonuclease [Arthrobacter zhangbolii]
MPAASSTRTASASASTSPAGAPGNAECSGNGYPDGFTGTLALANLESFDEVTTGEALGRMGHLISWAQAQQARLMNRMQEIFRDSYHDATGRLEPGMAFSLASAECAAILRVPQMTAQRLMDEAGSLCGPHAATLTALEEGKLSYGHAQVLLDQCENVPAADLPELEADLLAAATGQTRAQFSAKARRLRENKYPQTIPARHQSAFEKRKVTLDPVEDGMSWLSALLPAPEAQQIYTALSTSAQGEQLAGDPRTRDQLRADILAQLLMGGMGSARSGAAGNTGHRGRKGTADSGGRTRTIDGGRYPDTTDHGGPADAAGGGGHAVEGVGHADKTGAGLTDPDDIGSIPRAEIMVLISAETLFGANEEPAELHGYGPISAEAARRLARNATRWTGLVRDPHTGEILGVGRRRKVPAGLARWLRARDGTCRFPGCRVSTGVTEIDHTKDWAKGGNTEHSNLAHLCRRHHRFKTLGYWKACQPSPGVLEWTSPTGRVYRTEPFLELADADPNARSVPGPEEVPPF